MFSFFRIMGGYCKVKINGAGKERFLNLCKNKKILIWNLRRIEEGYTFYVSYKAHKMLNDIGEKSNTHIEIEGKYGLPFFLYRHKKRKMFYGGMLLFVLAVYILSLFIWDIQIMGTENYTTDEIETYLAEKGIHTGILKKKIDCSLLEERIREDFTDTAWVSCDLEGTLLTVHVKESIDTKDMTRNEEETANDIIASRDGVIESIVTRSGTPLVKQGMEVKQGDTLISGIIYYYNDYDELLETNKISADGDVKARTSYTYKESFPLSYYEKEYTGQIAKEYTLMIHGNALPAVGKRNSYPVADTITEIYPLKIGKSFYLPLSLQIKKQMEYEPEPVSLSEQEAKEKAEEKKLYYLKELKSQGKEIRKEEFQIEIMEGECVIKGTVEVVESIGKIRNIP
ncbi:MAG: sporulation protein YqfD [Lachnospiraceae bacterium]|nr:sporulation protein YqfD [Lachnospiraceae bacterium]